MTYKIRYKEKIYVVNYDKEITTDGTNVNIRHIITFGNNRIINGKTLEGAVKLFCGEIDKL